MLTPRERLVPPGGTETLTVTGRPDGPLSVSLLANGTEILSTTVVVDCDPSPMDQPEVRVEKSCLAGNGRIDVYLTNPRIDVSATYAVFIDSIPPKVATLGPGESVRVSTTGRPDGYRPLRVTRNGVEIETATQLVSIACDIDPQGRETVMLDSCLQGAGRFDIYLTNPADQRTVYTVAVTGLADRTVEVDQGDTVREAITGRPDGTYTIQVRRTGVLIATEQRTISCGAER